VDFVLGFSPDRARRRFWDHGGRRRPVMAAFVRQKRERYAEDVDVFGLEQFLSPVSGLVTS
jgi:hypothetical protein